MLVQYRQNPLLKAMKHIPEAQISFPILLLSSSYM